MFMRSVHPDASDASPASLADDRSTHSLINPVNPLKGPRVLMRSLQISALGAVAIAAGLGLSAAPSAASEPVLISQGSRAEQTCVEAARDQDLRVVDVTSVNETSDGAEVIMEVRRGRDNSLIGCDYSSATRDVELYRIEDDYSSDNDDNDDWRNQNSDGDGIRSEREAESVARRVVGEQLGIDDPYSDVVRIEDVQRENDDRSWIVAGSANGAEFEVRLRAEDGSVQDFELF